MTDLHVALLAAAVVVLLLLFGWSKWQERQQLRRLRERLGGPARDPLLGPPAAGAQPPPTRIEPQLGALVAGPPAASEAGAAAQGRPGRPPAAEPASAAAAPLPPRPQLPDWAEDPLLDCVVELRCAHAADGVAVIDATAPLLRLDCGLPVHVVAWDARAEQWVPPDRFGFYSELLASIQIANRSARLDDITASKFIAAAEQAALALDADFDPPELPRLRRRAAALAAQVAEFDVQIGLTLVPAGAAFDAAAVHKAALASALEPTGDGQWQRRGDDGQRLFGARLADAARLLLELDVPLAPAAARPLPAIFAAAGELAALLNARVVDDHGRPIGPGSLEAIEPTLSALYERMRAAGIEPGSARARRLFA